jgi:hypothetical protein
MNSPIFRPAFEETPRTAIVPYVYDGCASAPRLTKQRLYAGQQRVARMNWTNLLSAEHAKLKIDHEQRRYRLCH